MVLAAFAGAALALLARGNLKASDLTASLGSAAAVVAYATLGTLIVRRAGNLIGWLMLGEGAGLAFLNAGFHVRRCSGSPPFPGAVPAAKQAGTAAEVSFAGVGVHHRVHGLPLPDREAAVLTLAAGSRSWASC